jgi:hypothetical protein
MIHALLFLAHEFLLFGSLNSATAHDYNMYVNPFQQDYMMGQKVWGEQARQSSYPFGMKMTCRPLSKQVCASSLCGMLSTCERELIRFIVTCLPEYR